jgi:hypothetical protein
VTRLAQVAHAAPIARVVLVAAGLGVPALGAAQDPYIKPTTTTTISRLPGPRTVVGAQLADGRIEVRWSKVAGAVHYDITRSVPNIGTNLVKPGPTDTVFVDTDVKAGFYYYYVVQGIDELGTAGLKTGSNAVLAKLSYPASSTTTTTGTTTTGTSSATSGATTTATSTTVGPLSSKLVPVRTAEVTWAAVSGVTTLHVSPIVYRDSVGGMRSDWNSYDTTVAGTATRFTKAFNPQSFDQWLEVSVWPEGNSSLRVTAPRVKVPAATLPPPQSVSAAFVAGTSRRITWSYPYTFPANAFVERGLVTATGTAWTSIAGFSATTGSYTDAAGLPGGTTVTYGVYAVTDTARSARVVTAPLLVPLSATTGWAPDTMPRGSYVRYGPQTLAVGVSLSLGGTGGTGPGTLWSSLNPTVATVDASGNAKVLAPGSTQIVAMTRAADGTISFAVFRIDVR